MVSDFSRIFVSMKALLITISLLLSTSSFAQNVGEYIIDGDASGTVFYVESPTDTTDGIRFIVSDDIFVDSASTSWGCYGQGTEGYLELDKGYAEINTDYILASTNSESAASLVRGYGDGIWSLPTFREFEIMYLNNIDGFSGTYWMSFVSTNDHMCVYGNDTVWRMLEDSITGIPIEPDYRIYDTHAYVYDFSPNIAFVNRPKTLIKTDPNNYQPFRGVRYEVIPRLVTSIVGLTNNEVSIYPNPTNGFINIESKGEPLNFTIYNTQGKEVRSGVIVGGRKTLDLSDLDTGAYILRMVNDFSVVTKTVIVR